MKKTKAPNALPSEVSGEDAKLPLLDVAQEMLDVLLSLLFVINMDKDGSWFICCEAEDIIRRAEAVVAKAKGDDQANFSS